MIIGTFIMTIFKIVLNIMLNILISPLLLIKISFFWFATVFAVSYIFFLIVHKSDVISVRKDLAVALIQSLVMGFFIACLIEAVLQYWTTDVAHSVWFVSQQTWLQHMNASMTASDIVLGRISLLMIFLGGFFAAHYVGQMLDQWHDEKISERYGWLVVAMTLLCCAFMWFVIFEV